MRSRRLAAVPVFVTSVLVVAILAGCASGPESRSPEPTASAVATAVPTPSASLASSPSPASSPTPTPTAVPTVAPTMHVKVYFFGDAFGVVAVDREVPREANVAAAAVRALLAGPTDEELTGVYPGRAPTLAKLSTFVPPGTTLLGIVIKGGIATVNLSSRFHAGQPADDLESEAFRLAQVVYTVTQVPAVKGVMFQLSGKPMQVIDGHEGTAGPGPATRAFYYDQRRSVLVDLPTWGSAIGATVRVRGESDIPGEFEIGLVDGATDGILARATTRAVCKTPCGPPDNWGPFDLQLSMPAGTRPTDLRLRVWEPSFEVGGPVDVNDYPLR